MLDDNIRESFIKERKKAIQRFLAGRTPKDNIKWREGNTKGVKDVPYVTGSYIMRQAGLVTGFKWSHRKLDQRTLPDWWKIVDVLKGINLGFFVDKQDKDMSEDEARIASIAQRKCIEMFERAIRLIPREIMTDVEVTLYDAQDRAFMHTATGVNKVKFMKDRPTQPVSIGNAEKASETDGIKKALALAGYCPDVYGSKEELEALEEYIEED